MRLASQTSSHNIQTTSFKTKVLFAVARAENNQIPIAKYVRNTASANNHHANNVFFLLLCLLRMVDNNNNITANAQGLILSDSAAGSMIPKNDNFLDKLLSIGC
ncbi:MAG: hypothetical protein WCG98_08505 [bacterium]